MSLSTSRKDEEDMRSRVEERERGIKNCQVNSNRNRQLRPSHTGIVRFVFFWICGEACSPTKKIKSGAGAEKDSDRDQERDCVRSIDTKVVGNVASRGWIHFWTFDRAQEQERRPGDGSTVSQSTLMILGQATSGHCSRQKSAVGSTSYTTSTHSR